MGPLTKLASRLVPAEWRDTVARDLTDEAIRQRRRGAGSDVWAAMQAARIGVAFRWRMTPVARRERWRAALKRRRVELTGGSMRDVRYALRSLRRTPAFTLTALVALTLGIGAATTVFSVADRVLFRPLPYQDAGRLVTVGADVRARGQSNWAVSAEELDAWRQASRSLADLGGHQPFGRYTVSLPDEPVELSVTRITENFLTLLGVVPARGRLFNPADFELSAAPAVLLTDTTWRRVFHQDPAIVGASITMNGAPAEVAGILPASFVFPATSATYKPDLLLPLVRTKASSGSRITLIGRLRPSASLEDARAEINTIAATRRAPSGLRDSPIDGATVEDLSAALAEKSRRVMQLLVGAVVALLLIGCANVANLLLARGTDRRVELSLRRALGASRGSLVRLLLIESTVLAVTGIALGALLATWAIAVIRPLVPAELELLGPIAVDGRALTFASLAGAFCVLVAAFGPAWGVTRANLMPVLTQSSSRTTSGRVRVRQWLVGLEVALAVVLLVAAGLMTNTMIHLLRVDVGYDAGNAVTLRVQLPRGKDYPSRSKEFLTRALDAARGVPGVTVAGASQNAPMDNTLYGGHYTVEGFSYEWMAEGVKGNGPCCTQTQWVSASYFDAAGIALIRGRRFAEADASAAQPVAIIGDRLARKFPAGLDPIGHYLGVVGDPSDRRLIVGVVRDVRDMTVERAALPAIYLPLEERGAAAMTLVARTTADPNAIARPLRETVQRQAGPVIITNVLTLDDLIARSSGSRRLNAWLFGAFGISALALTAIGIGGVIAYSVARRTREIGVRLALGATPAGVRRLLVRESLVPVACGALVGGVGALALSQFAERLLFGVAPRDFSTYAVVLSMLVMTAWLAAYLPARRATRIDPSVALRVD